jgi:hypothetical protein
MGRIMRVIWACHQAGHMRQIGTTGKSRRWEKCCQGFSRDFSADVFARPISRAAPTSPRLWGEVSA